MIGGFARPSANPKLAIHIDVEICFEVDRRMLAFGACAWRLNIVNPQPMCNWDAQN